MMNKDQEERARILLYVQRALTLEVFPSLISLDVSWESKRITLKFFVDGPLSDEDKESISVIETELIADFYEDEEVVSEVFYGEVPREKRGKVCVFARRPTISE